VWGGSLLARDTQPAAGSTRHEVIPLTNISPERGQMFLSRLRLATASRLPGSNSLLVTAEPGELQKAITLLSVVDTRLEYEIKELGPAGARPLPASVLIETAVNGVSIGTLTNAPQDKGKTRAIVDVHQGTTVVVAPVFLLENIAQVVERGTSSFGPRKVAAAPETAASNPALPALSAPLVSGPAGDSALTGTNSAAVDGTSLAELQTSSFNLEAAAADRLGRLTPLRMQEMRERAAALQTQRQSVSQPDFSPLRVTSSDPRPVRNELAGEPSGTATKAAPPAAPPAEPPTSPATPLAAQARAEAQPSPAPAATTATPVPPPPAKLAEPVAVDETSELTLPERLPVIMLLDLVGKHLGLSYVYNPEDLKGEVSLKLNGDLKGKIKIKDLYPLLEQTLKYNNLVTTRHKGNIVTIVPAPRVMEIDPILVDGPTPQGEQGDTAITRTFELKHVDTTAAKNLVESVCLNVIPVAEKRMLFVTTYACRMDRVERLLQMIDQPGEPRKFEFRQLRYTMAKNLTEKVKAMAEQMLDSVSVTVAEPDPLAAQMVRQPGETDVAYRTRVSQLRLQQTALRQQQALQKQALGQDTRPTVYLDADERTNRILMIGIEEQLAVVRPLVEALDVEQKELRVLQLYRMKHVDAEEVARKLQELGIISRVPETYASSRYSPYAQGAQRITPQLPGQPRPPTPTTPEVQIPPTTEVTEKGLVEEPQVVVVEATNSLLVNGTAEQHAKIAHIIEYIDSETLTDEIPYKIYQLENSSPKHLSEVLQSLIQETVEQQGEGGKTQKVVVNRDERIKIVPDPNTYSLIVYANKKNQEWIANLIDQLDKRRPQVLIDCTLVEVTKDDVFHYSLDLVRGDPTLAGTSSSLPGVPTTSAKVLQSSPNVDSLFGLRAFYGDRQVQALLDTVQTKKFGRVLAKPKLLVNDNEQGKIETKDTRYVRITSSVPFTTPTAGTQTTGVTTSENFQPYDAGITLDITPHISEGELLRLDVILTRSDFLGESSTKPPDTKTNQVDTVVTLPNGSTVILGGLVKANQFKNGAKVPLLGDIPLLGGLFRSVDNKDVQSKLYIFVKAEIIRPPDILANGMKDLEVLSQRNREAFEKHELEFQRSEAWPGIKPKPLAPPKVLDAQ
jgi:type II secretory pathway component GspD/PulD (secretin)